MRYYQKALGIYEEIGELKAQAVTLNNIGLVHFDRGELEEALEIFNKALEININIKSMFEQGHNLGNIAHVYKAEGILVSANKFMKRALEIFVVVGASAEIKAARHFLESMQ